MGKLLGKIMRFLVWFVPVVAVFAVGFILAKKYDLAINQYLHKPENLYAIFMEAIGWYPAFIPTLLGLALVLGSSNLPLKDKWMRLAARAGAGVIMVVGFLLIFIKSYHYFENRGLVSGNWNWLKVLLLTFAVELVLLTTIVGMRVRPATRIRMLFWAGFSTVFLVANLAIVNLLKLVWQRTRFDDMVNAGAGVFSNFTAWTQIGGFGGSSFPSGHVANAAAVFALIVLCDLYRGWRDNRAVVTGFCWLYTAAMAFARIMIGRHYLSDTLAAAALIALLFYLLHHNRFYKRFLLVTLREAHLADIGEPHEI